MSEFYDDLATTAQELLTEFGGVVMLTVSVPGAYNPATGSTGTPTVSTYSGVGVKLDYSQFDIDGTRIKAGDQRVYLNAGIRLIPASGNTLTMGGKVYNVVTSRPLQPADTTVLHDVQVRGVL